MSEADIPLLACSFGAATGWTTAAVSDRSPLSVFCALLFWIGFIGNLGGMVFA